MTQKFVHEAFCLVGNSQNQQKQQQIQASQKKKSVDSNIPKSRNANNEQVDSNFTSNTQLGDKSTQGTNSVKGTSLKNQDSDHDLDED